VDTGVEEEEGTGEEGTAAAGTTTETEKETEETETGKKWNSDFAKTHFFDTMFGQNCIELSFSPVGIACLA
jgi:hypothetical protein